MRSILRIWCLIGMVCIIGSAGMMNIARADGNNGLIILDLTPEIQAKIMEQSNQTTQFQPMLIRVVKITGETRMSYWEANVTNLEDIPFSATPGRYKVYVHRQGSRTTSEFDNNGAGYAVASGNTTVIPLSVNWPGREIFGDAPWRNELNKVPILVMVKDANELFDVDIGNIYIYHDLDQDGDDDDDESGEDRLLERKWEGVTIQNAQYNLYYNGDWYDIIELDVSGNYLDGDEEPYTLTGEVYLHVVFEENGELWDPDDDWHSHFMINVNTENLPTLTNWYPGDTHYHSSYTDNAVEFGFPIEATVEAGKATGLDWNAITDHSFDLRDSKTADPNHKWNALKNDVNSYTSGSYKLILGEEVSCYGHENPPNPLVPRGVVHFLVFGMENFNNVGGTELDFIPGGHDEKPEGGLTWNLEEVIDIVNSQGGVSYAAHPEGHRGLGALPFDRVPWITEDYDLTGYNGLQVWNEKYTQGNDWKIQRDDGLKQWTRLLSEKERKDVFIAGGSDAHGDFSHHTSVTGSNDNAFGKVRTYVYIETFSEDGILDALKNGHSIMTDGPLVVFNITNEHGDTAIIGDEIAGRDLTLSIQWESTSEFGKVDHIYVHRGIVGETEEEISEYHLTPNNLSGAEVYSDLASKIPLSKTAYIRINATTDMDNRVYTNPIWINYLTPLDLCMVLDRSGSMRDSMGAKTKMQGVKEAATGVINVLLPQDRVSIVSFSDTATTDIYFTTDFSAVKTKINQITAGGSTSFGAGLEAALNQFKAHGNPDHISAILFMSDGKHNKAPHPDAFVTECKNKGIPIFTVGFASSESEVDVTKLKKMSEETGGEYHFVSEIFDLQNIFLKLQHKASGWESIATYIGKVKEGETITAGTFYVDPAINDLRVTLNWPGSNLDLKLFNPNGRQIDFGAPNVIYSGDTKPEYVIIKDPQSGMWMVKVYGRSIGSSEKYYVLVTKYVPPKPQICKVQITSDPSLQDRPSIIYASGNYYVAYQSHEKGYGIFIKKFDSQWNFIKKVEVVSGSAYYDSPSLVFANNKLYVAYVSNAKGANVNDYDVIVKEYNPNSLTCLRGEKYLTTLQSRQDLPALYYKDGYFYLAYRSWERGSSYNGDIYIKKFDSNWNQLKKVQVTSKGSLQARPSLTYANGYIYVAYYSMETGDRDIFVKRLNSNLNLDGFKKQITSEASEQSFPSISFVNNQFTIVYGSTETGTLGIYMKKYDSNWNFIEKTKVVDDRSAHERRPVMTYAQNNYWIAYVHNLVGSDDWNIFAIIPGCEDGSSPTPTPTPTPKLRWEITVDEAEYSPGDYVHLTQQFTNEGGETVLITNPITTTFIAEDGSVVLEEDLRSSISVTLGAGGQWSFGTSYKLPDDAPEGYYDVKVSISGGNYVKTAENLFYVAL